MKVWEKINMKGKEYTISLETLFKTLTNDIKTDFVNAAYGSVERESEDGDDWYFFKSRYGTPCMDGETCKVIMETKDFIELQEEDQEISFKLSPEEFKIAATEVPV